MNSPLRVLVAEDDDSLARVARHELGHAGYEVLVERRGDAAWERFRAERPAALLTDVRMPGLDGMELVERVLGAAPETAVLVMTAFGEVRDAVRALKRGAADYLVKPVDWEEALLVLGRALAHRQLERDNRRLRAELAKEARFERLVGESAPMRALTSALTRLLEVDATVLIEGESGTGKELVARALHYQGRRSAGPFVALNCAALPRDLIEAQLFGHEKGAFTGALRAAPGAFEQAEGGTLFLDEVGELPPPAQGALLRALSERQVQRIGADQPLAVDVRVVAATNRDLRAAVEEGEFREDLFFRLAVVPLRVPPLRERGDDVLRIAERLLGERGGAKVELEPEARELLLGHSWPGNVRELANAIEHAFVLRRDPERIGAADLPATVRASRGGLETVLAGGFPAGGIDLGQLERECLRRALAVTGGNQTRAAELLGLTRQTLIYRLAKYGLR